MWVWFCHYIKKKKHHVFSTSVNSLFLYLSKQCVILSVLCAKVSAVMMEHGQNI